MLEARCNSRRSVGCRHTAKAERLELIRQKLDVRRHIVRYEDERTRCPRRLSHQLWPDAKSEAENVGTLGCTNIGLLRLAPGTLERKVERRAITEELRTQTGRK